MSRATDIASIISKYVQITAYARLYFVRGALGEQVLNINAAMKAAAHTASEKTSCTNPRQSPTTVDKQMTPRIM